MGATAVVLYRAVRSRRRRALAIAWLLAGAVALTGPAAGAQSVAGSSLSGYEHIALEGGTSINIKFLIAPEAASQTTRIDNATRAALTMLSAWFGSPPPPFVVAGVPWQGRFSGASQAGRVSVPLRWLTPARDQSTERALIGALVRQYWVGAEPPDTPFKESLVIYVSTRLIHHLLEGSNFETVRFFAGHVPFPLRSVLLSPPVADPRPRVSGFEELESHTAAVEEVRRGVTALQTLERYVGWPTMLEAISTLPLTTRQRDADAFASVLSDVRGTDLRSLVAECLRADAVFDYAIESLQSTPGPAGMVESTVTITRRGSGRFAIGDEAGDRDASMPLLVRFADGSEARDYFDGAAPSTTLVYSAKSVAIAATVDPDTMLLLDDDRDNNTIVRDAPVSPLGIRLALHWMAWLQNAMLSYTALA
jgi:hypothetical protein